MTTTLTPTTLTPTISMPVAADQVRPAGRFARSGLASGFAAAVANLAVAVVARQADVALAIKGEEFPLLAFPQVTLMAAVIGIGLAAVFARRARRPRHTFVVTTVVLSALSMVPPAIVDATIATKLVLGLTHVVAAVIIIPAIARRLAS
jgi:hypothetical protein